MVVFNANNGSININSKKVVVGSTYGDLPTPVIDGYIFKGWIIRNISNMPDEYQELDYIESDGTQYILTDVIPTDTTGVYLDFSLNQSSLHDQVFFGSGTTDDNNGYWIGTTKSTSYFRWNSYHPQGFRFSNNTKYNATLNFLNDRTFKVNNETKGSISDTLKIRSLPIVVFAYNYDGDNTARLFTSMKLYSFKISDGTTIIRDYIPCYRKTDNLIGLYNMVEGKFYSNNSNTGNLNTSFIKNNTIVNESSSHILTVVWEKNN